MLAIGRLEIFVMMNMKDVKCCQCGSSNIFSRGAMTQADMFCGVKLSTAWPGGTLYECNDCHLAFRFPVRDRYEYLDLYKLAPEGAYHNTALRHDQILVRDAILRRNRGGGAILDIGCFNGALLASLGPGFDKFGIEASKAAGVVCREANVSIIADSAEQLSTIGRKFDVICLVDVVEHLVDPLELVKIAITKLSDGGQLIISTGNASSFAWNLFGGRYWYCSFPEHIRFISPDWLANIAEIHSLNIVDLQYFPHINPNVSKAESWVRFGGRCVKACAEVAYAKVFGDRGGSPKCKLGFPGVVNDHMLVILEVNH